MSEALSAITAPTLVVIIPSAPIRALGPNGRLTWVAKYRLTRQARHDAKYALLGQTTAEQRAILAACPAIRLDVIAPERSAALRMDDDNLIGCCKAWRDQIADELGVNDRIVRWGAVAWSGTLGETVLVLTGETQTEKETT